MIETLEIPSPVTGNPIAQERRIRLGERAMLDFFKRNPGEELTVEDAAVKFGMSERTARNYIGSLSASGKLERVSVYRLKEKS